MEREARRRGHVSQLPTLVTVQWVRLGRAGGSAEEERGRRRVSRVRTNRRKVEKAEEES